jgi:AraC family transcriptional regulator
MEIDHRWLERAREYSAVLDQPVDLSGGASIGLATRLFDEFKHLDGLSPLAMEGLLLELMAETSRRSLGAMDRRPPHWLTQVDELLQARFADNLALAELAEAVGVHTVHLARVFRKFHGCTIGDYVRQLRIEFASRELVTTDLPLAEIAAAAGFADQSHFSRTFKQHTRLLPTEFRNLFRLR